MFPWSTFCCGSQQVLRPEAGRLWLGPWALPLTPRPTREQEAPATLGSVHSTATSAQLPASSCFLPNSHRAWSYNCCEIPGKLRRFINWTDRNFSFFLYNEASFSKASLSAKPCSCQTLWEQHAEAVRSEPLLLTQQVCLCTSKRCSCWIHTGRAPLQHSASGSAGLNMFVTAWESCPGDLWVSGRVTQRTTSGIYLSPETGLDEPCWHGQHLN